MTLFSIFFTRHLLLYNLSKFFIKIGIFIAFYYFLSAKDSITINSDCLVWERVTANRRFRSISINWNNIEKINVFRFGLRGYRFFSDDGKRITLTNDRPGFDKAEKYLVETGRIDRNLKAKRTAQFCSTSLMCCSTERAR